MGKAALSGKYVAYAEYKDSGVEWFNEIPNHWRVAGFKKYFQSTIDYRGKTPEKTEDGILLVTARNIKNGSLDYTLSQEFIAEAEYNNVMSRGKPNIGDLLFTTEAPLGEVANVDKTDIALAQRVIKFCGKDGVLDNYYLKYLIMSVEFQQSLSLFASGSTVKGIKAERFVYLRNLLPVFQEQQTIANFLDHETAKIDTLIEKQQQLIALLKEKRQAVISHAVTKGLNPNAKMKDSGVEWLGEVPEGWGSSPLKHIAEIRYGIGEPPVYVEDGIALVRATNIRSGRISDINLVFVNPDDIPSKRIVWLKAGDIIVVRSGATTGDSSIIPKEYEGSIAGFDMVVRPIDCSAVFLGYAILSNYVRNNQIDLEKTRAAQPHLNAEELGECFILLPTKNEQIQISQHIERELSKFDILIAKSISAIELMQERRTALISAAVTGKIDVRNWKAA